MRITLPSGTPAELARPSSARAGRRGLVLIPDICGLRPLFDDLAQHAGRREHLGRVHVRPVAGAGGPAARRRRLASAARWATSRCSATPSARRRHRLRRGGGHGLLHGRHVHAEGRGHGPVRAGRRVLRHGPGRPPWQSPTQGEPLDYRPGPSGARARDRGHVRPLGAGRGPGGPPGGRRRGRALRGRRPRLRPRPVAATPTGPTTPPTPGPGWPLRPPLGGGDGPLP